MWGPLSPCAHCTTIARYNPIGRALITTDKIVTKSGVDILVEKIVTDDTVEVRLRIDRNAGCLLHWGVRRNRRGAWQIPPESAWPEGSKAWDLTAVQSPFLGKDHEARITLERDRDLHVTQIDFVLFFPENNRWDNNHGTNYLIEIPGPDAPGLPPIEILRAETGGKQIAFEHAYSLEYDRELAVSVSRDEGGCVATFITDLPGPLVLHWGVARNNRYEWLMPDASMLPAGTIAYQQKAAQTPFCDHGLYRRVNIKTGEKDAPCGILFVMLQHDTGEWLNNQGNNFYIPIVPPQGHEASLNDAGLAGLADEIISREMSRNSWTLMHRFNLCHDLLDRAGDDEQALSLIFVWLRFSALRQLDWQRNYNTKPRELSHAMDRLTLKLADRYAESPAARPFVRLILTTVGRGGEGQKIRDEILNIMHRHKIKEVAGHFMEEWHQKLHNNTTPDDVVICEAYIEFLKSNGGLDSFYATLKKGGVTRKRLNSYERPIRTDPDFVPHLKGALIRDFEHFLSILKAVHAGADLATAIDSARRLFDKSMHDLMDSIWQERDARDMGKVCALVEKISEARRRVAGQLAGSRDKVRDLLFLDLALEDFVRVVVERNIEQRFSGKRLVALVAMVLENVGMSHDDEELRPCLRNWERLAKAEGLSKEWALQAMAALERLGRALGLFIDRYYKILQPKAELLGRAFEADDWTVRLFGEGVVRGRPAFALSLLLRHLDPIVRKGAGLGDWQVVSPGRGAGHVEVVDELRSIQGGNFSRPTIIVADEVAGDEEIPKEVAAVITSDVTDIVSHVAIRARNAGVLFATCYDAETFRKLKSFRGEVINLVADVSGDVKFGEGWGDIAERHPSVPARQVSMFRPVFTTEPVSMGDFSEKIVGAKSINLKRLQERLPGWIALPRSVALPFGVFEHVVAHERNREIHGRCREQIARLGVEAGRVSAEILGDLRRTISALEAPDYLRASLDKAMQEAAIEWSGNWNDAWACIKRVWGSKWNERAYLSRITRGIVHDDLFMAVLVQEVVEAEYSFVVHTVNPLTGDRDEIYAEVVPGLGETLVGNYPGRALGFTCGKGQVEPQIRSFPSKGFGLFGSGIIFRSDSSGEDLSGYAGAGLYDSVMLPLPRKETLDYSSERLVLDDKFRGELLSAIGRIGLIVEKAMGSAQDIEGAYSKERYYVVQTRPQVGIERPKVEG